ncbi:MAG: butyrate kinase [Firmicutes bacterium]|nr:butyrate kinase [Bacillota bacterium]
MFKIFVINPGSTSTKVALYEDNEQVWVRTIRHKMEELAPFARVVDQLEYRLDLIRKVMEEEGLDAHNLDAVMGRGGMIPNMQMGGYLVDESLIKALSSDEIRAHAANLGGLLAYRIASLAAIPAYTYDAVTANDFPPVAKITGIPDVVRAGYCHVLNTHAMGIKYAERLGRPYEELNLCIAHLGGGVSVSAHVQGKIVDSSSEDDGAFAPERSGSVPLMQVIDLCYSGKYTKDEMKDKVRGKGGLYALLGTKDIQEIEHRIEQGDEWADLVFHAQALQIAKGIGVITAAMKGNIDAIILTGGMAYSKMLTDMIIEHVRFMAPVVLMPGENEMEALAEGGVRILNGTEKAHRFEGMQ